MFEEVTRKEIFNSIPVDNEDLLDIGSGKSGDCFTLDKDEKLGCTYTGDMRTLFAPVYNEDAPRSLKKIKSHTFGFVKMQHIVEHIEWIYQQPMFNWVYSLLRYDGVLFVETPNVDYILKQYLTFAKELAKQHPDISSDDPDANIKWLNSKLYSGCSTNKVKDGCVDGDFHLCMYNKDWLVTSLLDTGFKYIKINSEETLSCLAYKEWNK